MDKKICVLHVAEAAGGVERYLETLFKYNDEEIENILVCSQNYDYKKFNSLAKRVIVLKMSHEIDPLSDIKVEINLRKIIKRLKPDIVYAHSSKAGALARIANLGLKNKLIYNPHGWAFNMQQSIEKKEMYKWVEKISAHFCDKIVCISNAEKKSALKEKICKVNKLKVIRNGIDFDEFSKEFNQSVNIPVPKNSYVVGMVGRLSKQKAPDIFVKAAKLIKKEIPNAFFLMVGDGELRSQIEKQIKELELEESFYITGWVDNPAIYMKRMNVGMLLSRWEGFGLVLPEYMLAGVPIVATKVDAIPEIIKNNENGLLVASEDYQEASKSVVKLFNKSNLRKKLISNARVCVKAEFNGNRVQKESKDLYCNLLKL